MATSSADPVPPQNSNSKSLPPPQGVQCDFDDGFCPSWRNVLMAIHNITLASRGELGSGSGSDSRKGAAKLQQAIMMLRPRAWNMTEMHLHVNGKAVPGPLVDFG